MSKPDHLPIRGRISVSDLNSGTYHPDTDTLDALEDAIERLAWSRFGLSVEVWFDPEMED